MLYIILWHVLYPFFGSPELTISSNDDDNDNNNNNNGRSIITASSEDSTENLISQKNENIICPRIHIVCVIQRVLAFRMHRNLYRGDSLISLLMFFLRHTLEWFVVHLSPLVVGSWMRLWFGIIWLIWCTRYIFVVLEWLFMEDENWHHDLPLLMSHYQFTLSLPLLSPIHQSLSPLFFAVKQCLLRPVVTVSYVLQCNIKDADQESPHHAFHCYNNYCTLISHFLCLPFYLEHLPFLSCG
jgi:hypothetical protein